MPDVDQGSVETLVYEQPNNMDDLDKCKLIYDENGLDAFGSIQGFMDELSEGECIIILLSPGYFQSPYCLTELCLIYSRRAHELIPVVAFVDGYQPSQVSIKTLIDHWKTEQAKAETSNNRAAANCYGEFIRLLPVALAWLLGTYDHEKPGWDTLFPVVVVDDEDQDQDQAAEQVHHTLSTPIKPRFTYHAGGQKAVLIAAEIEKILTREGMRDWFASLKARFSLKHDSFAALLARPEDAARLTEYLDYLIEWLDNIRKGHPPSTARQLLSATVKELLGYVLLTAVDDGRLHQLIHKLNHLQAAAHHELLDENETAFQMIASAIGFSSVRYRFNAESKEEALTGEGQLELIDRGCSQQNYYQWLENEEKWFDVYQSFYKQMTPQPRRQRTERALHGALDTILRRRTDFYLLLDKTYLDICETSVFRKKLAERFPAIQQIISYDQAGATAGDYYLDGLNSGDIDQQIYEIYSRIHELSQ